MTLKDVNRVGRRLQRAILALAEVVAAEREAEALATLYRILDYPREGAIQQLQLVRDGVTLALHLEIRDDPNRTRIFPGLGVLQASWTGNDQWDGVAIAKRLVARGVDEYTVDKTTGEIRPPAVFAEMLLNDLIACAGFDRTSQTWRKEELKGRGIDPDAHIRRDPDARKTVRRK